MKKLLFILFFAAGLFFTSCESDLNSDETEISDQQFATDPDDDGTIKETDPDDDGEGE